MLAEQECLPDIWSESLSRQVSLLAVSMTACYSTSVTLGLAAAIVKVRVFEVSQAASLSAVLR